MNDVATEEVRGSAPVMTTKDLILELYADMKVVRPAVEALQSESLPSRIRIIENRHLLEDGARNERGRLGSLSNKTLAVVVLVGNFLISAAVALAASQTMAAK